MKKIENTMGYLIRKRLLGLAFGFLFAIIVLNVDKKLWWPLELEATKSRNIIDYVLPERYSKDDVVLILFDDRTQFLLRDKGMPIKDFEKRGRDIIASAIQKLESYNPKSIGINLNLGIPSGTKSDDNLAQTLSKFKNIVVADSIYSANLHETSKILKNASGIGFGELFADYDNIVHKINLFETGYTEIPSFSYALYRITSGKELKNIENKNSFFLRYPKQSIKKYSFIDLIRNEITSDSLKGKTIILGIGLNNKLIKDHLLTPFQTSVFISDSEVQAIALANLLNNSYLFNLSINEYGFHLILFSMILGMIFSTVPFFSGALITITFLTLGCFLNQYIYSYSQILVDVVPLLFILLGNFVIGSLTYLQLNLHEQNVELGEALEMLSKRSSELENSQEQLENKNEELSSTLSELQIRIDQLRELRKQLSNRSEEERKRIARELHDDTLARITDLKIYIESLINSGSISISEKQKLGITIQTLDNVTYEIRRVINALRPSMLDNALGFIHAIENLLDLLSKRSSGKIQTKLLTPLSVLKFTDECEINLYRIVQEALNNVFKHSQATKVEIVIQDQPGQILILINDNGIGFSNNGENKKGFGLVDMKERAELIGVSMQYLNRHGGGTTLELTIPMDKIVKFEKTDSGKQSEISISSIGA
jgi:signal transduction histidine kinase